MAEWKIKGAVEETEQKTAQQEEQAVLDKAVEEGNIEPEAAGQDTDETPKINLNETKEEVKADEEPAQEEASSEVENESPLELISDEKNESEPDEIESNDKADIKQQVQEEELPQVQQQSLPENVDKLVEFMQETGGTLEDYVKLNADLDKLPEGELLREYYKQSKPWDSKEVEEYLEDNFSYDEENDDAKTIRARKRAFKEELYNAKKFLNSNREKYYADLKLNKQQDIPSEYQEAFEQYNTYKQSEEVNKELNKTFLNKTETVFNNDFKGFDFQVGSNKYRYKVANAEATKVAQSDIGNFIGEYLNDKGEIEDAAGYHKALFTARNADKLAEHFYEQGRADALRNSAREAKNIDMGPRQEGVIKTKTGQKFRVVSGDSSSKLKIKLNK